MSAGDTVDLVYVERAGGAATADRLEFDTFQGGADLMHRADPFGAELSGPAADAVRGTRRCSPTARAAPARHRATSQAPDVANDGDRVAFAARASAGDPLGVWTSSISTGVCTQARRRRDGHGPQLRSGVLARRRLHRVRVDARQDRHPRCRASGSCRSPTCGAIKLADGSLEQMTFLSNSEISPQFMREGRVTMTTEKVSDGFYQLSGRRLNWDLTDYHPLLAQRKDVAVRRPRPTSRSTKPVDRLLVRRPTSARAATATSS